MDGNIKNNPKRPQDKPKEQRNDPPQEQWQDPPQEQPHGQPHEQQEAQVSHAPRHGVVDGGDAADDNEAAAAAQEEGEEEEKEEEEKEEEEEEAVVILRVTEVGETEDTAPCCIVDQDTGRAWSVRILNRLEQRLQSGKFSLSDGVWDDTFNHFFSFYPQLMPFATRFVSQLPQEHRWDLFRIGRGDNDPEVTSRDLLDEFFQALARREIGKFFLYGDLPSELLQSFALQFYQARHGNDNKLLDELHVNSRAMLGQPAGVPDCPLLLMDFQVLVNHFCHFRLEPSFKTFIGLYGREERTNKNNRLLSILTSVISCETSTKTLPSWLCPTFLGTFLLSTTESNFYGTDKMFQNLFQVSTKSCR